MFSVLFVCHSVQRWKGESLYSPQRDTPSDMFKLILYEAWTVSKQAVGIRLKCLLVCFLCQVPVAINNSQFTTWITAQLYFSSDRIIMS